MYELLNAVKPSSRWWGTRQHEALPDELKGCTAEER